MAAVIHFDKNFVKVAPVEQPECDRQVAANTVVKHSLADSPNSLWQPPEKGANDRSSDFLVIVH